ncbi:hypothetical protein [Virgibacillus doumboii]|uniref:hypothetical protein n=1 Tax=Virgibacillus doumboii TaxID=2697503 RepID=UPI0013E04811|nr:hypothetical protein [Virgibacillus doumboii]
MEEPRSEIDMVLSVINQQMKEEDFFNKISDADGRLIVDSMALQYLKQKPSLLKKFLLSLSVEGRIKILFLKEMLGMTQSDFIARYGVTSKYIQFLKGQDQYTEKKPKASIRDVTKANEPRDDILATIATFTRVPLTLLKNGKPLLNDWHFDHFKLLPDAQLTLEELIDYLKSTEENAQFFNNKKRHTRPHFDYIYDVRGIILHHSSTSIYIRASVWERGGFVVEFFGKYNQLNDFVKVKSSLEGFEPLEVGYCRTVIENHAHMMVVAKSHANQFTYPIEFKRF